MCMSVYIYIYIYIYQYICKYIYKYIYINDIEHSLVFRGLNHIRIYTWNAETCACLQIVLYIYIYMMS